ncbi:beta-ketoacyl synthase N-terminal-like domain-containing protein [Tenacibaculum sp. 1_MG-2023]|uniref:beta-ketoacyl synthase N-terminal-like domain-containing protein n=1 Tax=Tenacibaculum sp. 1_MG-2023 TaxID=3062653 RepID=UPI0026E40902|nr:beta-ketoacyl synthase N-terminal-like domain-containing protein [Tenacibaculum sp. 1_MG-2023]MDO6674252.1 beta-ketoacyl synthase N-terminal-like domain-containing protein [Tenacibaculum sp. 1_MG-2023]
MKELISITSFASVSALGSTPEKIWENYLDNQHFLTLKEFKESKTWVAQLTDEDKRTIEGVRNSDNKYKNLDPSVLYTLFVARKTMEQTDWKPEDNFGINIGSSRGATSLFEKYHKEFLATGKSSTLSSPTTTLGNISSWIAHDLQSNGPEISHSITCSTGLHSLLNGVAWLQSGMSEKFMIGASEASLTDFTIAQMQALKVYSKENDKYPCKAFDLNKTKNTMVLGEGASVFCLERGAKENAIAFIEGVGYATEVLKHNTSVTTDAECFQKSMKMALGTISPDEIDAIIMHAPGTIKGDQSEINAIQKVFCKKTPFLTTNKWKLGHTFGASGLLSLELAVLMLQHQQVIEVPFAEPQHTPKKLNKILVNAVGFGGNAVSVLITTKNT